MGTSQVPPATDSAMALEISEGSRREIDGEEDNHIDGESAAKGMTEPAKATMFFV